MSHISTFIVVLQGSSRAQLKTGLFKRNDRGGLEEAAKFERCASGPVPEDIGLSLREGKEVLKKVQRNIVQTQIRVGDDASGGQCCPNRRRRVERLVRIDP